jgi:hypothetical protein
MHIVALTFVYLALACAQCLAAYKIPKPLYGVNLGNWLLYEPWMSPKVRHGEG